jgi:hypothetical protein
MVLVVAACNVGEVVPGDAAPVAIDASDASVDAPGPGLAITPSQNDFGAVGVGQTSAHVAFVVSTGSPTGALSVAFVGPNASDFTSIGGNCDGAVLVQPGSCSEWIVFQPTGFGSRSATLRITGAPGGTVMASLLGTGRTIGNLVISPSALSFGSLAVGQPSAMQSFTMTNSGPASVGPLSTTKAGTDPAEFEVITDLCNGHLLAAGASCTVDVRFQPTALGAKSASIGVHATAGGTVNGALTGTGIVPPVALAIAPTLHDFGTIPPGLTSPPFTFTVMNTGVSPSAPLTTTSPQPFAIVAGTDTCIGTLLAPGATCTLQIRFTSTTFGSHGAAIQVEDGTASATAGVVGLTAGNDFNTLSPSPVVVGDVVVGGTSAPQLFTVTNGPWTTHAQGMVSLHGTDPSEFSIATDNCTGASLAPNQSCTFSVVFTPTSPGQKTAAINTWFMPGGMSFASISGTGVAP